MDGAHSLTLVALGHDVLVEQILPVSSQHLKQEMIDLTI